LKILASILLPFLFGAAYAEEVLENDYTRICNYQTAISTHITYELLQGATYADAVKDSFALFASESTQQSIKELENALRSQFNNEQRTQLANTMGLAGVTWAHGFREGFVIGTYGQLYERSYATCIEGSKEVGLAGYFDIYYLSLMLQFEEKDPAPAPLSY